MNNIDENFFNENQIKKAGVENFLGENEKILWKGKPKKMAYVLGKTLTIMPIGLIWGLIDFTFLFFILSSGFVPRLFLLFIIPFFALHLTPFWIWLKGLITASRETKTVFYMFTTERFIVFKGENLYIDSEIYISNATDVKLKINFIDKILKVGDIFIYEGERHIDITDIPKSEFIYSRIKEICKNNLEQRTEFYVQNIECLHCGTIYDTNEKRCPSCGSPNKNK